MKQTLSGKGKKTIRGLGDVVEATAKAVGADKVARAYTKVTGKDCGCAKRRDTLNERFPFKNQGMGPR